MVAKSKKEKHEDQVQFASYKSFCESETASKTKAVEEANQAIEDLKADIFDYGTTATTLGEEITKHDEDISVWTGDLTAIKGVRAMEKADYDALHKDLSESVDALERAIDVLNKNAGKIAQAASLVQMKRLKEPNLIPEKA